MFGLGPKPGKPFADEVAMVVAMGFPEDAARRVQERLDENVAGQLAAAAGETTTALSSFGSDARWAVEAELEKAHGELIRKAQALLERRRLARARVLWALVYAPRVRAWSKRATERLYHPARLRALGYFDVAREGVLGGGGERGARRAAEGALGGARRRRRREM